MELLTAFSIKEQVDCQQALKVLECATTEEAISILKETEKLQPIMDRIVERIRYYMEKRAQGKLNIDCILYSNEFGELAKTREAKEWFILLEQEQVQSI